MKPAVIANENIKFFDIDETLVLHDIETYPNLPTVFVRDHVLEDYAKDGIYRFVEVKAHTNMIRLLQEEKARGATIIVWSRGGYRWARDVVEALDLNTQVDFIMSKPLAYFDDSPCEHWMESRIYLDPKSSYKNLTEEK